jgi:predicted dehydrogenase
MASYRVAVIGVAHMHVNELMRKFAELPNVEMVAIADTVPEVAEINVTSRSTRGHTLGVARDEIGIKRQYDDYRVLLEEQKPDIAIVCSENARHGEVTEACAAAGAHVVTEKPMAASLAEALRMTRACERYGRRLMVNWPSTWSPAIRTMKRLLDEGAIGRLWQVHARYGSLGPLSYGSTHPGVKGPTAMLTDEEKGATWWHRAGNGGGALLDYCCYGACLSRWYFGEAAQAAFGMTANFNTHYGSADDNAVLTVRYPKGMAVLEATWSTVDHAVRSSTGPRGRCRSMGAARPRACGSSRGRAPSRNSSRPIHCPRAATRSPRSSSTTSNAASRCTRRSTRSSTSTRWRCWTPASDRRAAASSRRWTASTG